MCRPIQADSEAGAGRDQRHRDRPHGVREVRPAGLIDWICTTHGLSPSDAYFFCSLAGDLSIHQIIAPPTYNVGMTLPLAVFTD